MEVPRCGLGSRPASSLDDTTRQTIAGTPNSTCAPSDDRWPFTLAPACSSRFLSGRLQLYSELQWAGQLDVLACNAPTNDAVSNPG